LSGKIALKKILAFFFCVFVLVPIVSAQDTIMSVLLFVDATSGSHPDAPMWLVIPFVLLISMIAAGPLFLEHFWHKYYPVVAITLAAFVEIYYLVGLHNIHGPVHSLAEYVQFISLLAALYIASAGIIIRIDRQATPIANVILLISGAVLANIVGTTGASMLLIRPFMQLNRSRISAYHVVFFIFIVSNIGGALTPIGDPPLFLGYLRGVSFFWPFTHNVFPWLLAITFLSIIFYFFDKRNKKQRDLGGPDREYTGKVTIAGYRNFGWLGLIIGAVFLDPNVFSWVPAIHYDGQKISFLREVIMLATALVSYRTTSKSALEENQFTFEPIREVAYLFIGIFGTMMPALELVGKYASSAEGAALISDDTLYWFTGFLSGFLDNAPTYVNFLTAAMASKHMDVNSLAEVNNFSIVNGSYLTAISLGAVFFGSFTYIGNGPNFMVKSIAEEMGLQMPGFFGYIFRYSIPVLIPLFVIIWMVFFW